MIDLILPIINTLPAPPTAAPRPEPGRGRGGAGGRGRGTHVPPRPQLAAHRRLLARPPPRLHPPRQAGGLRVRHGDARQGTLNTPP